MDTLEREEWARDKRKAYAAIESYDKRRRGGSRISTAREIIQEMSDRCFIQKDSMKTRNHLTDVLDWLYYRKGASK